MRKHVWALLALTLVAAGLPFAGVVGASNAPDAPIIDSVETRNGLAILTWEQVDDAVGYNVFRNGQMLESIGLDEMPYNDMGPAGIYTYEVSAFDSDTDESQRSEKVEADTTKETLWVRPDDGNPTSAAPTSSCDDGRGGVYEIADQAKDNYRNDCGRDFENTTAFRCDWVNNPTSGFQCSGPATGTAPELAPEPEPVVEEKVVDEQVVEAICTNGKGGIYETADQAKDNYRNDCGRDFNNTTAFRCDWVDNPTSGFQCSGPTSDTDSDNTQEEETVEEEPVKEEPVEDETVEELAVESAEPTCDDGRGGIYETADEAKDNYRNDCGRDFESTTAYRCDWVNNPTSGFQCSGPTNDTDDTDGDNTQEEPVVEKEPVQEETVEEETVEEEPVKEETVEEDGVDAQEKDQSVEEEDFEPEESEEALEEEDPIDGPALCEDGHGGIYETADQAKDNYRNDCGRDFESATAYRCDWVNNPTSGFQCSGPTSDTDGDNTQEEPVVKEEPVKEEPVVESTESTCDDGRGGTYATADEAKDNYDDDCGEPFGNTTAFSCDWVDDGFQCSKATQDTAIEDTVTEPVADALIDDGATEASTDGALEVEEARLAINSSNTDASLLDNLLSPKPVEPTPTAPSEPSGQRVVVSMGDSYISGESGHLIGNNSAERRSGAYEAGTEGGCRRSDVAPIHSANIPGVTAINIACSGATTSDIGSLSDPDLPNGRFNERLQIHQLENIVATNDVEMVVLSIGGNDIHFDRLVAACASAYSFGSTCSSLRSYFEGQINNTLRPRVSETVEDVKRVLNNAGQSDARIVLVSYPSPVPASASYDKAQRFNHGCPFSDSDMQYMNHTFVPLIDLTMRSIADARGVDFLSLSNSFDGKELCSPRVTSRDNSSNHANLEWATGIRTTSNSVETSSMHPNALGQQAIGQCVGLVWNSSSRIHKCYNNGGGPTSMRLGGNPTGSSTNLGTAPECSSAAVDPDGDGWGFENGLGCKVIPDIVAEDVDCKDVEGTEAELCGLIMERINDELEVGRVSLDQNGLLFTYNDPTNERINSGCTTQTFVTNKTATARIGRHANLKLSGNAITEPIGLRLEVPFSLNAKIDFKTRLHAKFFRCLGSYASDSYHAKAAVAGTADVLVAFNLDPTFETNQNGDLVLTIEPRAHVAMDLRDPHLNFKMSGVNPLAQLISLSTGMTALISEGIIAGISGDSFMGSLESNAMNVGLPFALTTLDLTTSTVFWEMIENEAERELAQAARNIAPDLENDLNTEIAAALELDASGQREFVVPANFAQLLQGGATLDDLLRLAE